MNFNKGQSKTAIFRRRRNQRCLKSFGGKCGICGYNKCKAALAFHHLAKKTFLISDSRIRSWERIVEELRKCVLLCENCHREIHVGITELPKNIRRFDESYATYVTAHGRLVGSAALKERICTCAYCAKSFPYTAKLKRKFCSKVCTGLSRIKKEG